MTCLFYYPFEGFPLELISHPIHLYHLTHYPQVVILSGKGGKHLFLTSYHHHLPLSFRVCFFVYVLHLWVMFTFMDISID